MKSNRFHTIFIHSPKEELDSVILFRALENGYDRLKMAFGNSEGILSGENTSFGNSESMFSGENTSFGNSESMFSGENTSFGNSEGISEIQKDYKIIVF